MAPVMASRDCKESSERLKSSKKAKVDLRDGHEAAFEVLSGGEPCVATRQVSEFIAAVVQKPGDAGLRIQSVEQACEFADRMVAMADMREPKGQIDADEFKLLWINLRTAWERNKYHLDSEGRTAYGRLHGREGHKRVCKTRRARSVVRAQTGAGQDGSAWAGHFRVTKTTWDWVQVR